MDVWEVDAIEMAQFQNTCRKSVVGQPVKLAASHKMTNGPRTGDVRLVEQSRTRPITLWRGGWLPDPTILPHVFEIEPYIYWQQLLDAEASEIEHLKLQTAADSTSWPAFERLCPGTYSQQYSRTAPCVAPLETSAR